MNPTRLALPLAVLALTTGCGALTDSPSAATTTSTPTPVNTATPVPSPTFPIGIYVAAHNGADSDDGSALRPMKTIHAALDRAIATGVTDVYLIGGGPDAEYREVVLLEEGVNLHGSVCTPITPPLQTGCMTVIDGGSPSVVGLEINRPTLVENVTIRGLEVEQPAERFFAIPEHGCAVRSVVDVPGLASCDRPMDDHGRPVRESSVGMLFRNSKLVKLHDVEVYSADGENGLEGLPGVGGVMGAPGASGAGAGSTLDAAGAGATTTGAACAGSAGGAGGSGGHFALQTGLGGEREVIVQAQPGFAGDSSVAVPAPIHDWRRSRGQDGASGVDGADGLYGANGASADKSRLDLVTLTPENGKDGGDGTDGLGGSGGAGGAPGSRNEYREEFGNPWTLYAVAGDDALTTTSPYVHASNQGETAGGGGGAGGAGGCHGTGGQGGQSGGSSIGILVLESQISIEWSRVEAKSAGRYAAGGQPGYGQPGGAGGSGGAGAFTANVLVNGDFTNTGAWVLGGNIPLGSNGWIYAWGASLGGKGGNGGHGGWGGSGGVGGWGASGASVAILQTSTSQTEVVSTPLSADTTGSGISGTVVQLP